MTVLLARYYDMILASIYWEQDGRVIGKTHLDDGTFRDARPYPSLTAAWNDLRRGHGGVVAIDVPDIRVGMKYLGKSMDVLRGLPEVKIDQADANGAA